MLCLPVRVFCFSLTVVRTQLAALLALEKRSKEFLQEKEEKRRLEDRIVAMQSQLLIGGHNNLSDTPAFRSALQQEQYRIRKEYESRLLELEQERQSIEEDKAQVDRYKQLLLKQRDIMIALTARLNERDESVRLFPSPLFCFCWFYWWWCCYECLEV